MLMVALVNAQSPPLPLWWISVCSPRSSTSVRSLAAPTPSFPLWWKVQSVKIPFDPLIKNTPSCPFSLNSQRVALTDAPEPTPSPWRPHSLTDTHIISTEASSPTSPITHGPIPFGFVKVKLFTVTFFLFSTQNPPWTVVLSFPWPMNEMLEHGMSTVFSNTRPSDLVWLPSTTCSPSLNTTINGFSFEYSFCFAKLKPTLIASIVGTSSGTRNVFLFKNSCHCLSHHLHVGRSMASSFTFK